jgi:uncharacterized protein (TIGR04255 family)
VAEPRHLPKAPIREAVIQIRTPLHPDIPVEALSALAHQLPEYPQVSQMVTRQLWIDLDSEPEEPPLGMVATTEDGKQIVQYRKDGFSFTQLAPYGNWTAFKEEALRLWSPYQERFGALVAERVSTRYINHLHLIYPLPSNPAEFILGLPEPPDGWPHSVVSFLYRHTLIDFETEIFVNVTQFLLDETKEDQIGIAFDIEAFKAGEIPLEPARLDAVLDGLRDMKNRIFFNGLTDRMIKLYE